VLVSGQRVSRVCLSRRRPSGCASCVPLSAVLGSAGTKPAYPAHGAGGVAGEQWKAAASALWYGLVLPCGLSLVAPRPTDHGLKRSRYAWKRGAAGNGGLLFPRRKAEGTSFFTVSPATDPKRRTAINGDLIGARYYFFKCVLSALGADCCSSQ